MVTELKIPKAELPQSRAILTDRCLIADILEKYVERL